MLKVRFAPSPTGYLHIGGARTCLFNWLYARKNNGQFLLRIEDTDLERSKEEYLDEILESIKWLGMDWDDVAYQSKRFDLYQEYAQKLIAQGKAEKKDGAVFFKYDFKQVEIDDLVRGKIVFNELPKDEEVIIKSDGSPTYNFCCVIDDALMEITTVIRGEDHISNTPKQVLIYQGLGFKVPQYAHVPLILSPDGGRMSKRYGATSIREYKEQGYLPEALVNYLMLLGWSAGDDKEILSLGQAKEMFDLKRVNKTGAAFSCDKLNWVNFEYIKTKSEDELTDLAFEYMKAKDFLPAGVEKSCVAKIMPLFRERIQKLDDLLPKSRFIFYDDFEYTEAAKKVLEKDASEGIQGFIDILSKMDEFNHGAIEREFRALVESLGLKVKDLIHPTRIALCGDKIGPGLFESITVLGKEKVLVRTNN